MKEITSHGFDEHIRGSLRYHDFDTHQLDRVRNLYNHALVQSGSKTLKAEHFDEALEYMESHPDWSHLSPRQREAVVGTFKKHLGIVDPKKED